ncbi:hypothetical protein ACFV3R_25355 [Streptomyces sp. NPDC059740]|uniref:hypothetical protein n=1 Tax=Streptomyces sp. NPDC059740 TaxID=3346926 RepID=UPI0036467D8F
MNEIHAKSKRRKTLHVWSGQSVPEPVRALISQWLTANGVDPQAVALEPITLEFVPRCAGSVTSCEGISEAPWWIAFTQHHRSDGGAFEVNVLTGRPAAFTRTVPLLVEPPLDLVPEWAHEVTHVESDPVVRVMSLSEFRESSEAAT